MTAFTGTPRLMRLVMRREWRTGFWWVLAIVSLGMVMVTYIDRNMPTLAVMATYVDMINQNTFFRALGGGTSVIVDRGFMSAFRSGGFLYIMTAIATALAVVRYTRADEDTGRTELLRSGAVSRFAALTSALLVAGSVALVAGALTAITYMAVGLEPLGSITYGAGVTAAGWVFGAIAALAAQLAQNARTARAIALFTLAIAYVLRYAGDASGQLWMTYISPMGWVHAVQPYRYDRWWVLALIVGIVAIMIAIAYVLVDRRDLGEGLIPQRRGRAAAPDLRGPIGLSWRLHRGLFVKWAIAIGVFALGTAGVGTIAPDVSVLPAGAFGLLQLSYGGGSGEVIDYFLWAGILIFAHVVSLYPVVMVQRLRAEERAGRAELAQGTTMTRVRWAAGHLVVTALGTAGLLVVTGLVLGYFYGLFMGALPGTLFRVTLGTLSCLPGAWLITAVCFLAYALTPRFSVPIAWAVWVWTAVTGQVAGPLYGVWGGTPFEPFHYLPNVVAGAPFNPVPVLATLALTALVLWGGLTALRRRDVG
ncbi:ABC transporter permease [Nonomuraea diastatica]|uniref:Polyketide antibiotic transporter n=1 Tax=Nonomuraea diastatica TaxID=1848329 RepID=A0A4R4WE22_9ACTN|nr:polyketide antibiotic transporter [Nonomuraea diastatica]TDD15497.1 polyketide antibiotic transporter [Nonomuraea diastatica]